MKEKQSMQDLLHLFPVEIQKTLTDIANQRLLPSLQNESILTRILDSEKHPDRIRKLFSHCFPEQNNSAITIDESDSFTVYSTKDLMECYLKYINHCNCSFEETLAALEYKKFRDSYSFEQPLLFLYIPKKISDSSVPLHQPVNSKKTIIPFEVSSNRTEIPDCYAICLLTNSPKSFGDRIDFLHFIQQKLKKASNATVHLVIADAEQCYQKHILHGEKHNSDPLSSFLCLFQDINGAASCDFFLDADRQSIQEELYALTKEPELMNQYIREEYRKLRSGEEQTLSHTKGLARGRADSILTLLSSHGPLPFALTHAIQEESNLPILTRWLKLSAQAGSLQEFIEEM